MRISISNIAWDRKDDDDVAAVLAAHAIDAIDVAPGKYFPDPAAAGDRDVSAVRTWWHQRGIEIIGLQALLFGTQGLNMFADEEIRDRMIAHLSAVCRVARGLGARHLVFGSPRNRDRRSLVDTEVERIAIPFFRRLGNVASEHGVVICLEPNPVSYGCNFMTTCAQTLAVVRATDHPSIRMQLDTGALTINGEDVTGVMAEAADVIGHIHASEPDLVPLGQGGVDHALIAAVLRKHMPAAAVTIEMLTTGLDDRVGVVSRALDFAARHYGEASR